METKWTNHPFSYYIYIAYIKALLFEGCVLVYIGHVNYFNWGKVHGVSFCQANL